MPFKKIDEPVGADCIHPQHNPPMHIVLKPGSYEWTCPACGAKKTIRVPRIT